MCLGICIETTRVDIMCLPRLCSTLNFDTGSPSEPRVHWFYYTSWPASSRNSFVSTSPALGLHRCRGSLFPLGWSHQQTLGVRLCLSVLRSQTFMALYSFCKGIEDQTLLLYTKIIHRVIFQDNLNRLWVYGSLSWIIYPSLSKYN